MPEKLRILYEDKFLVVVYKPENMLTVPYPGSRARTALDVLTEIRRKRGLIHGSYRPAAVHRLDRETSGLIIYLKKRIMFLKCMAENISLMKMQKE